MKASDTTLIRAGWLIDGTGGPALSDVILRLEGDRVSGVDVGPPVWDGNKPGRIDLSAHTLLPWFIDAHVHLFMTATSDPQVRKKQLDSTYEELHDAMLANAAALVVSGVIAARDGGDYGGYSLRLRDEGLGELRLRAPGRAYRARRRYGRLIGGAVDQGRGLADAIRKADAAQSNADHVKVAQSGLNSLTRFGRLTRPQFTVEELRLGVEAARERGLPVMAHANGSEPVAIAVEAGCASVEHGFFMGDEILRRLSDSDCVWVPTAVTMQGYAEGLPGDDPRRTVALQNLEQQLEQIARGRELGATIACGTDAGTLGVPHGRSMAMELSLLVRAGFTLEGAVAAATSVPARLLGLDGELGLIAPGRPAAFLGLACSPSELLPRLGRPDCAWLRGREVKLDRPMG